MFNRLQFDRETEALVRFVEETAPDRIIAETIAKLRVGVPVRDLLRASALAVTRSSELSVGHHGGPTHPVAGIYPAYHTSRRLSRRSRARSGSESGSGDWAFLPVVQNLALSNLHIHSPEMGAYIMPELAPVEAREIDGLQQKKYFKAEGDSLEETRDNFVRMMRFKYPAAAEGHLLWLLPRMPHGEVMDLILAEGIPLNPHDDHYFLFPMYTLRALDVIGWEWAPVLLRTSVRWQARNPFGSAFQPVTHPRFAAIEELVEKHGLVEEKVRARTDASETEAIGRLGGEIGAAVEFGRIPELVAEALADGLSLEGAGEALSIGAGTLYLRTDYGNPMDAHFQTGINARRLLLGRPGIRFETKLLGLLSWNTGPEIMLSESKLEFAPGASEDEIAALPERGQAGLLEAIEQRCYRYPVAADLGAFALGSVRVAQELHQSMALAQQYAERGYDAGALFERLARVICRDDFTEMHAFKQHQATVEEYESVREPFRWVHLVGAVKYATMTHGARQDVYSQAAPLLELS